MSRPSSPPPLRFFVDRSLGRYDVPQALRAAGFEVVVMAEHYGEAFSQGLADERWLADAGREQWIVLTKDARLTQHQADGRASRELAALVAAGVRVFCLMNANLGKQQQVELLLRFRRRMVNIASTRAGPYVYGIYVDRMREVWPEGSRRKHPTKSRAHDRIK